MKRILTFFLMILSLSVYGQQFSFQMFFTDAVGNKDTITLGYDLTATDSIDPSFGEVNIIGVPLDTGLDVRVTNELRNREFYNALGTYHTKKQITYHCSTLSYDHIMAIDIYTKHWPVTATWDKSLFINDDCRKGSVFTSVHPGGWWDVGSPSDLHLRLLATTDSVTFSSNASGASSYIKGLDTIPVFWLAINNLALISSVNEISASEVELQAFPNPSFKFVSIANNFFEEVSIVEIFNLFGQAVLSSTQANNIDIGNLPSGLYFVKVTNRKGITSITKLQKM